MVGNMKYLINYADEKFQEAQKLNTNSAKRFCNFDKIIEYGPDDIDKHFFEKNKDILTLKRGNGLWLWKPYIIKKTLDKINYGDIVFYCDSGACFFRKCDVVFNILQNQDIWVTVLPLIERQWTKKTTFEIMQLDIKKYGKMNQVSGTFIALKKSDFSIRFVDEWLSYCENYECISPSENRSYELREFIEHREDQSILSLLVKKYNIKYFSDPSQFGVYPEKYMGKEGGGRTLKYYGFIDYKPFILHHRRNDKNFIHLVKCLMRIYLPKSLQMLFERKRK